MVDMVMDRGLYLILCPRLQILAEFRPELVNSAPFR
jgi:hypothetical protein